MRGYFGIGIEQGKNKINYGTLYRTAYILGASFVFIIGHRFRRQSSDTTKSWRHLPTYSFKNFDNFYENLPYDCILVGIEMIPDATYVENFEHPQRACYLLGAEDTGLSKKAIEKCHTIIKLRGNKSLNVAVAGSIVLYDRISKEAKKILDSEK